MTDMEEAQLIQDDCFDAWAWNARQRQYMGSFDLEECAKHMARIRQEAAKAERERIKNKVAPSLSKAKENLIEQRTMVSDGISECREQAILAIESVRATLSDEKGGPK